MPFAESFMISGVTTAAQTATLPASINVNCGFLPSRIELLNLTRYGTVTTPENIQSALWNSFFPGVTFVQYNETGTNLPVTTRVPSNGISLYDGSKSVLKGPAILGGSIVKATSVATTLAPHGLQTGDIVLMTNNAVMKQIGGLYFSITVTGASTFTVPMNLNSLPADETAFVVRKVQVGPLFYPEAVTISAITNATSAVVSTTFAHRLTVGQRVRLRVSEPFGMIQANNVEGTITIVNSTTSFTLGGVDSSAWGIFAYPVTSAAAFEAATFPSVVPVGASPVPVIVPPYWTESRLEDAETNVQFQGFTIGTGLLQTADDDTVGVTAGDVLAWTAWRADV